MELHEEELAFDSAVGDIDLRCLQLGFAGLFDRAAQTVQRLGLDVDDIVFDRILVCRTPLGPLDIRADWLSDKNRLIAHIDGCIRQAKPDRAARQPTNVTTAHIVALKVIVHSEPLPTREFPFPES